MLDNRVDTSYDKNDSIKFQTTSTTGSNSSQKDYLP